jgi:hypothetical protein
MTISAFMRRLLALSTASAARTHILPSKAGNTLKVLRVNAGETDYELATVAGGSGLTHPQTMARLEVGF